jgi:hypothetical protein
MGDKAVDGGLSPRSCELKSGMRSDWRIDEPVAYRDIRYDSHPGPRWRGAHASYLTE